MTAFYDIIKGIYSVDAEDTRLFFVTASPCRFYYFLSLIGTYFRSSSPM
jgi:hypothetical protein